MNEEMMYRWIMASTFNQEEIKQWEEAEFQADVNVAANHLRRLADWLAAQSDVYVVAAALEIVWEEYDQASGDVE